jgi:ferric-dicitrate binding protein FerR (iron transport regulator)
MENKRLEYLLNNYLVSKSSAAEEEELFRLLSSDEYDEQVKMYMSAAWHKTNASHKINEEQSERILASIFSHERAKVIPIQSHRRKVRMIWAAASLLIVFAGISLFYLLRKPAGDKLAIVKNQSSFKFKNDVSPGSSGAILRLADGSSIVLDSAADGNLTQQGNMTVVKNGGSLNYIQGDEKGERAIPYNTIETPRGRQYQLALEDGTKVWLNAASSIRFPVIFEGNERKVEIIGEAYFEVAKNKEKPFRVAVNGTTVEVLGTHFNINSYADETTINTTLLEGSVKIIKGDNQETLSPGQQAQVDEKGEIRMAKSVNISEVMAWKDNYFSFNNTDIKKLMRQLSRWYDVEIVFKGENKEPVTFNGDISRTVNLSTVLKMLELTGEVNFSIDGKKIIINM